MRIQNMHAAELVRNNREACILAVTQEQRLCTVKLAGTLIQRTQEAAAYTVFGNHHFQTSLNHALQRQLADAHKMLYLRHCQLGAEHCACSALLLPELQCLAVENVQRHICYQIERSMLLRQGPQAVVVDINKIRLQLLPQSEELVEICQLCFFNDTRSSKGQLTACLAHQLGSLSIIRL